jgi:hypothetical protein
MIWPVILSADEIAIRVDNLHPVKVDVPALVFPGHLDHGNLDQASYPHTLLWCASEVCLLGTGSQNNLSTFCGTH